MISKPYYQLILRQSSGKSSVLQSLSGIPFPSGSGLVTRCPTQLIMSKSPANSPWKAKIYINYREKEKAQPLGTGPVSSVLDLCGAIKDLTNILTNGQTHGFSTDIIVIELSSPDSPDLTIIDLPGIIRTGTNGQNSDVVRHINELIDFYIHQKNTIILAVIPSNQDIATVDILERASRGDPSGARTLGVLTKPDLIGEGNEDEIIHVITNMRKPLLLGYVMVKNMTQKEVRTYVFLLQNPQNDLFSNRSLIEISIFLYFVFISLKNLFYMPPYFIF